MNWCGSSQGVTGFFVHARAGLEIAYMQEEWFACFQLCVDTAEELGMSVYIYDENGWPSGFCGGAIPALGEAYQYKYLAFSRGVPPGEAGHRVIAAYACEDGRSLIQAWWPITVWTRTMSICCAGIP